jgi:hypothetical protein
MWTATENGRGGVRSTTTRVSRLWSVSLADAGPRPAGEIETIIFPGTSGPLHAARDRVTETEPGRVASNCRNVESELIQPSAVMPATELAMRGADLRR